MPREESQGASRTALLVIDMQPYFLRAEYPFAEFLRRINPAALNAYGERVDTIAMTFGRVLSTEQVLERLGERR